MKFFTSLFQRGDGADQATDDKPDDQQMAIAVLLVEGAKADEVFAPGERAIIEHFLAETFELDATGAATLCTEAETVQADAVDLHRFTKQVKELPAEEKIAFIQALWRIVLSDGDKDAYEDALIRRICGLIYVTDRESGDARKAAQAGLNG